MLKKIRENMKEHRPPAPVILLVLVVLAVTVWLIIRSQDDGNGSLKASGTIEGITVSVASETAGKVKEVLVDEGQPVTMGDPLLRLDESLLTAQRAYAEAGVVTAKSAAQTAQMAYESAQIQYDIALTNARATDNTTRIADWIGKRPDYFDQPAWYFTRQEQIDAAEVEVSAAEASLKEDNVNLEKVVQDLDNAEFLAAEQRLANARIAYLVAKDVSNRAELSVGTIRPEDLAMRLPPWWDGYQTRIRLAKQISGDEDLHDAAQEAYDAAKAELESAQAGYDDLLGTQAATNVLNVRANLAIAQERLAIARDRLSMLQAGDESPQVTAAAKAVEQAKAAAAQSQDATRQAEANLALIDTQLGKLEVAAPTNGVVLTRNVEPGEFVQPGTSAIELIRLDSLTITVYVPEDRYGKINLGQKATVTVDSFPSETFSATVIYISDQAEFTPRNVQTVEGRSTTVYAIKLRLDDPSGKLKPGMPADVVFEEVK